MRLQELNDLLKALATEAQELGKDVHSAPTLDHADA